MRICLSSLTCGRAALRTPPRIVTIRKKTTNPSPLKALNLSEYTAEKIRNFCIIAHVDHGKSTLADRLLEVTGAVNTSKSNKQLLDKLQVERERGITVKAQSACLFHEHEGCKYMLNLIDTPGHVDFHYEVKRSLAACQGVILLVDANQGVQAQTLANFHLAFDLELPIIPVLNKIDLKTADPEAVIQQMQTLFAVERDDVIKISAKNGVGVNEVLQAIITRIPSPEVVGDMNDDVPLKALLFDSWFDKYKGAIINLSIKQGQIAVGDKILSIQSGKQYDVQEVGIMSPESRTVSRLLIGQVGYVIANMKRASDALIGDTICHASRPTEPLMGFVQAQPMVYAGVFPTDQSQFSAVQDAITKLTLNDASVEVNKDHSAALGQGWRLGFLGLLHLDVFEQRLSQEFHVDTIITAPHVPYKVKLKGMKNIKFYGGETITVLSPANLPPIDIIEEIHEPMVLGTIIVPDCYIGEVIGLLMEYRGTEQDQSYIDDTRLMFKVKLPLNEIIFTFFDKLKAVTSGYGSFDYEDCGYKKGNLVKLDIWVHNDQVEELTTIVHKTKAEERGREICLKLKENLSREQFEFPIRALIGGRIIARETMKPFRKDVTAKVKSGHDMARKKALLDRQKEGKKLLRAMGTVRINKDIFVKVLTK